MARPRSVSEEEALERALDLFWARGYDRTSIADLSAAIGLGPSSIYNAFGSKLEVFRRALSHYVQKYAGPALDALDEEQPAAVAMRGFLRGVVQICTLSGTPPGCAVMQGGGAGVPVNSEACAVTLQIKAQIEARVTRVLQVRARSGDALAAPVRTLAKFMMAAMRGLSQLACDGATKREMLRVADHAAQSCTDS